MTYLTDRLCVNALLTLKVENSLIYRVGTNTNSVHYGRVIDFALENVDNKKKHRGFVVWNKVFWNLNNLKLNHN
jgi:hypothetical protein